MKEIKRIAPQVMFYDGAAVAGHLEKMAAKGWLLSDAGNYIWTYRKIAPQALRFTATYFSEASAFDPGLTSDQQALIGYCEAAGWTFAAQWSKMLLFWTADEHATPIETDEAMKLKIIHKSQKGTFLTGNLLVFPMAALQFWMIGSNFFDDPVQWLANGLWPLLLLLWVVLLGSTAIRLIGYAQWYFRSKRAVAQGGVCVSVGPFWRYSETVLLAVLTPLLLVWLALAFRQDSGPALWLSLGGVAVVMAAAWGVKTVLKRRGASRAKNRNATFAVILILSVVSAAILPIFILNGGLRSSDPTAEDLPLVAEDLTGTRPDGSGRYRWRERAAPLMRYCYAMQYSDAGDVGYEIAVPGLSAFYGLCRQWALTLSEYEADDCRWVETDPAPWGAAAAYEKLRDGEGQGEYVLCFPDRVVKAEFYHWDLTPEQMGVAGEKLREA